MLIKLSMKHVSSPMKHEAITWSIEGATSLPCYIKFMILSTWTKWMQLNYHVYQNKKK